MSKNIVICSDGTGNTTVKGRGTNIFKLFEAVDLNGHHWDPHLTPQVAFYDDGVGTEDFKPLKILGGAAGLGLGRNVRQLYKELARIYDPDDRIYMFGFSRGAFTVRSLVGLIATCGLVDRRMAPTATALDTLVNDAYSTYRGCYRTALAKLLRGQPTRDGGAVFREKYALEKRTPIHFVGVFDTVDAVGLPFHLSDVVNSTIYRFKFPDRVLSDSVTQAFHALSIDEQRQSFQPVLWDEARHPERITQVWFAGVHSNVGGGYPKQGMSLVALDWMMRNAEEAGLRFNCRDRETYRDHSSSDDKLYDSRAGLGTFYRWKPRDVQRICAEHHMGPVKVHVSALERLAHGTEDYAPANMPPKAVITYTATDEAKNAVLLKERAAALQEVYDTALREGSLLERLRGMIVLGRLSYYLFLVTCTAAVVAAAAFTADGPGLLNIGWSGVSLVGGVAGSPIETAREVALAFDRHPIVFFWAVLGLLLSSLTARISEGRISAVASEFWHDQKCFLRVALQGARIRVAARTARSVPQCWTSANGWPMELFALNEDGRSPGDERAAL